MMLQTIIIFIIMITIVMIINNKSNTRNIDNTKLLASQGYVRVE